MKEAISPQDILSTTTLRQLKEMRKKLKKAGNQPFTLQIVNKRIKQIQDEHMIKADIQSRGRLLKFLNKVAP